MTSDPLERAPGPIGGIIQSAWAKGFADGTADAVRAAGYKSPDEIAAALDAEEAKWKGAAGTLFISTAIDALRAALLGTDNEAHCG